MTTNPAPIWPGHEAEFAEAWPSIGLLIVPMNPQPAWVDEWLIWHPRNGPNLPMDESDRLTVTLLAPYQPGDILTHNGTRKRVVSVEARQVKTVNDSESIATGAVHRWRLVDHDLHFDGSDTRLIAKHRAFWNADNPSLDWESAWAWFIHINSGVIK